MVAAWSVELLNLVHFALLCWTCADQSASSRLPAVADLIDMDKRAAIDRQRNAGNEIRLIGRQKQRGVCDDHAVVQTWKSRMIAGARYSGVRSEISFAV